ncbi:MULTISPECIES: TraR/DksA family transcriptional regulator [Streptomyces]|uniref:TraR/DksA family transcriptional regulator n=1 Tax=Streptomyces kaempferi TaxID=333725 RepID=A0ABW3XL69_9ACTN|nr:TraR/DksA C4-type zinc finger protein [Streptomyces sp. NBC_01462]
MSLDVTRTEPRRDRPTVQEARRRLEHARGTRLIQLRALTDSGPAADDHLTSAQKYSIERVLKEIDAAFVRIEDGTYGTCLGCARSVPAERLEILPYTGHCVACLRRAG